MEEAGSGTVRYWCYMCLQVVNPAMEAELKCPLCQDGFLEEIHESLSSPIMVGNSAFRRRLRAQMHWAEREEGEDGEEEEIQAIIRTRRTAARVLNLLQSIRSGIDSGSINSRAEMNDDRIMSVNLVQDSRNPYQDLLPVPSNGFPGLDLLLQHLSENDLNRYGTPPAKREAVEALPIVEVEEATRCSICLDDSDVGSMVKEMPCKHKFHGGCILPWLELHSSCPVCRFQMPVDSKEGETENVTSTEEERDGISAGQRESRSGRWLSVYWPFSILFSP